MSFTRAAFATSLALVAFVACKKPHAGADAGALPTTADAATTAAAVAASPAPSGSACDGPVFDFGSQERLRWGTEGALVRQGGRVGIDLGRKVRFHTATRGDAITGVVELACPTCTPAERDGFDAQLATMIGKRVRATGTLEPAWTQATAAPSELPLGVRLSVAKADVALVAPK